ncbi:MAG: polysaccharide biosynthesis protein [Bacteroidales bacterium]|nr:polysaccharide biosynthesis protein [Bacteroidales bacterium]
MQEITLTRRDIIWSYVAQFLSMGVGILTLPFILHMLSAEEIGLNYVLVTIGGVINLVDLGFAPQFARNFTYVFSGAREFRKEGIGEKGEGVDYQLLGYLLRTARWLYAILALVAVVLLLGIGTPYLWYVTKGFSLVSNSLWIWIVFAAGVLFQVFYSYYASMLIGAGKIMEQKYSQIASKLGYLLIVIGGLYGGWGLMSVALATLISPFFGRFICHWYFYTPEMRHELARHSFEDSGRKFEILKVLWYNAKRTAVMSIGAYAILRTSMFIAGLYFTLDEFGSYGLMVQVVQIVGTVSTTFMTISQPRLASLRTHRNTAELLSTFGRAYDIWLMLYLIGAVITILWGNDILGLIGSNAHLPGFAPLALYCLVMMLEQNHSCFAILISSDNKVPFAPAAITTGIVICIGTFLSVRFTDWGILGLVGVQGICQAAYQNWKWPQMALNEFHVSLMGVIRMGLKSFSSRL